MVAPSVRKSSVRKKLRRVVLSLSKSQDHICFWCGCKMHNRNINTEYMPLDVKLKKLTADHVVPTSKGGDMFSESNIVACCLDCNRKRGNKMPIFKEVFEGVIRTNGHHST